MGFGGPVWHASVSRLDTSDAKEALALVVLSGCGDARLGEWRERGPKAFHIRRRLTDDEAAAIGPAVDIRGTPEAAARMRVMRLYLPPGWGHREI